MIRFRGGISLCSVLTVVFIILKLTGYIEWSWLWVLGPIWIPIALVFAFVMAVLLLGSIVAFLCWPFWCEY